MKLLKGLYSFAGRAGFRLGLPLLRIYLRRSRRVYGLLSFGNKVLVVKSWLSAGTWHLPGGGMRKNESPTSALGRELAEEIGLELPAANSAVELLTSGTWQTNNLKNHYQILHIKLTKKPKLKLRRPEILEASWLGIDELNAGNTPAEILAALERAGQLNLLQ